jgi:hypothetical protein
LNVLRGFSVRVEITNGSDDVAYRAEGAFEFELEHDVIGRLRVSAEAGFDVEPEEDDATEPNIFAYGFESPLDR